MAKHEMSYQQDQFSRGTMLFDILSTDSQSCDTFTKLLNLTYSSEQDAAEVLPSDSTSKSNGGGVSNSHLLANGSAHKEFT